jgi:hypothetical protein
MTSFTAGLIVRPIRFKAMEHGRLVCVLETVRHRNPLTSPEQSARKCDRNGPEEQPSRQADFSILRALQAYEFVMM